MADFRDSLANIRDAWVYDELAEIIRDRDLILYAGAGLSAQAETTDGEHPPTWLPFLRRAINWCLNKRVISSQDARSMLRAIDAGVHQEVSDSLFEELDERRLLQRCFDEVLYAHEAEISPVHVAIAKIGFRAFLTGNFEDLLEVGYHVVHRRALRRFYESTADGAITSLKNGEPFLLKVHGDLSNPKSVILGKSKFNQVLHSNSRYEQILVTIFSQYSVLFLGSSGLDEHLEQVLTKVAHVTGTLRHHWLLVPERTVPDVMADYMLRKLGIQVVEFEKDPRYSGMLKFLRRLRRAERSVNLVEAPEQLQQFRLAREARKKEA